MEYRVSKASTVTIITAFTRHQQSIDIFFSLFSMKYDIKYKMQLTEGFWDKILHFKSRTQCFSKEEKLFSDGLSLEAIHQSSGSSFRDFFAKATQES